MRAQEETPNYPTPVVWSRRLENQAQNQAPSLLGIFGSDEGKQAKAHTLQLAAAVREKRSSADVAGSTTTRELRAPEALSFPPTRCVGIAPTQHELKMIHHDKIRTSLFLQWQSSHSKELRITSRKKGILVVSIRVVPSPPQAMHIDPLISSTPANSSPPPSPSAASPMVGTLYGAFVADEAASVAASASLVLAIRSGRTNKSREGVVWPVAVPSQGSDIGPGRSGSRDLVCFRRIFVLKTGDGLLHLFSPNTAIPFAGFFWFHDRTSHTCRFHWACCRACYWRFAHRCYFFSEIYTLRTDDISGLWRLGSIGEGPREALGDTGDRSKRCGL